MPDPSSLSLIIIALYFGFTYFSSGSWWRLLLFTFLAAAGTLVKIPFGLFLALLAFPFFSRTTTHVQRIAFAMSTIIVLAVVWWWYFEWNMQLAERFGQWYNSGKPLSEGAAEILQHGRAVLERFYFSTFHSFILGIAAIGGWCYLIYRRDRLAIYTSLVLLPMIAIYMMKSGSLFSHHGYYALILVPFMAFVLALFLDKLSAKWAAVILMVGCVESIANQQHDFFIKPQAFHKLQLEQIANSVSNPNDLVGLVSNANPNEFYFLNRKGWLVDPRDNSAAYLHTLFERGCKYVFIPRERHVSALPFNLIFENEHYVVFALN